MHDQASPSTSSGPASAGHIPVLLDDVLELLGPPSGSTAAGRLHVDGTVGLAGHAAAFKERGANLVVVDRDAWALAVARAKLGEDGVEYHHAPFSALPAILAAGTASERRPDSILLDLGVSSPQLDDAARGFSFRNDGPLDMRMDPSRGEPLSAWLEQLDEGTLANILYEYGEERRSRPVARAILQHRPYSGTLALADVVARAVGGSRHPIHPATRSFQALRIFVNGELDELDAALRDLPELLAPGGRLGIISFHSLEDRRVKVAFRRLSGEDAPRDVRGNPLSPPRFSLPERRARKGEDRDPNPRARSARLRVLERLT